MLARTQTGEDQPGRIVDGHVTPPPAGTIRALMMTSPRSI